jgi:hypothetical protein
MSTNNIAIYSGSVISDTNATKNTLVQRDSSGGITGAIVYSTSLQTTGTFVGNVVTETASFTAGAATDYLCDCTSGAQTVTLPSASASAGMVYYFMKKDSSGNAVTISGVSGTGTISTQYVRLRIVSDGTNWYSAA